MDVYYKYKQLAHSDPFLYDEVLWKNFKMERLKYSIKKQEPDFLLKPQRKNKENSTVITFEEINNVIESFDKNPDTFNPEHSKIVLQKSKIDVSPAAKQSGCWTTLVFLFRDNTSVKVEWYIYALFRARIKLEHLDVDQDSNETVALGYAQFNSKSEKVYSHKVI